MAYPFDPLVSPFEVDTAIAEIKSIHRVKDDYTAQADDEISIQRNQFVYLLRANDKVRSFVQCHLSLDELSVNPRPQPPRGFVPTAHLSSRQPLHSTTCVANHVPSRAEELAVKRNERMHVYFWEEEHAFVRVDGPEFLGEPRFGFIPRTVMQVQSDNTAQGVTPSKPPSAGTSIWTIEEPLVPKSEGSAGADISRDRTGRTEAPFNSKRSPQSAGESLVTTRTTQMFRESRAAYSVQSSAKSVLSSSPPPLGIGRPVRERNITVLLDDDFGSGERRQVLPRRSSIPGFSPTYLQGSVGTRRPLFQSPMQVILAARSPPREMFIPSTRSIPKEQYFPPANASSEFPLDPEQSQPPHSFQSQVDKNAPPWYARALTRIKKSFRRGTVDERWRHST